MFLKTASVFNHLYVAILTHFQVERSLVGGLGQEGVGPTSCI